ncbi:MAG: hypothetical protein QOK05_836 [Chloroflexota bacterium]|jgi:hypothetical protein|nr:hypothetical protein [Chloroflexota bacterium]
MKPLSALGLVLLIVGGLVVLVVKGLQPLGGALLICGAGLVIYSFLPQSRRPGGRRGPYSWEDDEKPRGPRQIYTADPGEVAPRSRPQGHEPDFVTPTPGTIPPIRQQASGGSAEYTTGHNEVPEPRERERMAAEYTTGPQEMRPDDGTVAPPPPPGYPSDTLAGDSSDIPPMAPPPPR